MVNTFGSKLLIKFSKSLERFEYDAECKSSPSLLSLIPNVYICTVDKVENSISDELVIIAKTALYTVLMIYQPWCICLIVMVVCTIVYRYVFSHTNLMALWMVVHVWLLGLSTNVVQAGIP